MVQIAYIISDSGDGSASVRWFKNVEKAQAVVDNDDNCEQFGFNEGRIKVLNLPDDLDLDTIGISKYSWCDDNYDDEGNSV